MPSAVSAQVCVAAATIAVTDSNPLTVTGVVEPVKVPSPSSPSRLVPQHCTAPDSSSAQVWAPPADRAVTGPASPATVDGVGDDVAVLPVPTCSELLLPQHFTVPSPSSAHVWDWPALIAVTPLNPLTMAGVREKPVVPYQGIWPQHDPCRR